MRSFQAPEADLGREKFNWCPVTPIATECPAGPCPRGCCLCPRLSIPPPGDPMNQLPKCPKCDADDTYQDGPLMVCPLCAHEWTGSESQTVEPNPDEGDAPVRDANGNILQDGDAVVVIKDLKVKGSSLVVKGGTKVRNIRLVDGDHNIDCKIDGIGAMQLKSEFVRKA